MELHDLPHYKIADLLPLFIDTALGELVFKIQPKSGRGSMLTACDTPRTRRRVMRGVFDKNEGTGSAKPHAPSSAHIAGFTRSRSLLDQFVS